MDRRWLGKARVRSCMKITPNMVSEFEAGPCWWNLFATFELKPYSNSLAYFSTFSKWSSWISYEFLKTSLNPEWDLHREQRKSHFALTSPIPTHVLRQRIDTWPKGTHFLAKFRIIFGYNFSCQCDLYFFPRKRTWYEFYFIFLFGHFFLDKNTRCL